MLAAPQYHSPVQAPTAAPAIQPVYSHLQGLVPGQAASGLSAGIGGLTPTSAAAPNGTPLYYYHY